MRTLELFRLALGNMRRTPLRVALTTVGVMIGSGALVTMLAFGIGLQRSIERPFQELDLATRITVELPKQATPASDDGPRGNTDADSKQAQATRLDDDTVARLRSIRGVRTAYPSLSVFHVHLANGEHSCTASIGGPPYEIADYEFVQKGIRWGRYMKPNPEDGIPEAVLGMRLLEELGFDEPDDAIGKIIAIRVRGLDRSGGHDFEWRQYDGDIRLVGVWKLSRFALAVRSRSVLMLDDFVRTLPGVFSRSAMRQLAEDPDANGPSYDGITVRVARLADLHRVCDEIEKLGYRAENFLENMQEVRKMFLLLDTLMGALGIVALVIASLGIVNTQLMAVLERYEEIAVYKAIGATNRDVRTLFLSESAVVGVAGSVCGLLLAWITSAVLGWGVNLYMASQGVDEEFMVFEFPPLLLVGAVVLCTLISVVSGWYPAKRATRIDPAVALRH